MALKMEDVSERARASERERSECEGGVEAETKSKSRCVRDGVEVFRDEVEVILT